MIWLGLGHSLCNVLSIQPSGESPNGGEVVESKSAKRAREPKQPAGESEPVSVS